MRTHHKLSGLLACALAIAGCASHPPEIELPPLPRVATSVALDGVWYRQGQPTHPVAYRQPGPLVSEGRVYHADRPDRVIAFDAASGRELWRQDLHGDDGVPAHINSRLGAGVDVVYAGTQQGIVYAFGAADGELLWKSRLSSEVAAPPVSNGRLVVARSNDGRIYGLDAGSGSPRWIQEAVVPPLSLQGASRAHIADDRVYVGLDNGRLLAIAADSGEVLWETAIGIPEGRSEFERLVDLDADPVHDGSALYVASYQARIASVSAISGRIHWSRDLSSHQGLRFDGARLYVSTDDAQILALDPDNGAILWRQDGLSGREITAPVLHGDMVAVADFRGYMHFLSPEDGRFVGRLRLSEAPITADPVSDGARVYVVDAVGAIQAMQLSGIVPEVP
ncbi:MAG: outer membrane protein assembly factor BamB [Gammaproteobacteria bacterium]|nr:outer membrane protein assembly factor BamB [Gammaproteobacteria bacterium]